MNPPGLTIGIGASAGGLRAIYAILERLPENFPARILIATHRCASTGGILAQLLQRRSRLGLIEPIDGEELTIGRVYLGRPDERIELRGDRLRVSRTEGRLSKLQCIDDLFSSIARAAGPRSVGIILSGMLDDGTRGLRDIRDAGGACIVQRPRDAEYQDMPMNALREVDAHFIGSAAEIADRLVLIARSFKMHQERSHENGA